MTGRYALVDDDGQVRNVVLWDGEAGWSPPPGLEGVEVEAPVSVGWRLDGGVFVPPAEGA